jgi:hypothetical protein
MKIRFVLALFAAAAFVGGCEKKEGGDKGDAKSAAGESKSGGGTPKACEDFFAENKKCVDKAMAQPGIPDEAKKATKDAMEQAEKQWKDMLKDPASAKAAEDGCKQAAEALKNNPTCK